MLVNHPDWAARVQFQHAMFYDQQGKWEKAYEALKKYSKLRKSPNLRADLVMVKSCMNLNMGLQAMDVTKRARDVFPGSFRLDLAESAVWDVFGFKEQALYVISRTPGGKTSPVCVALLYSTGRLNAARNLSEATGVPLPVYPIRQLLKLPDAGFSMQRHWPAPLTQEARKKRIAGIEKAVQDSISPYFKALRTQELAWHRARALANEVPASVTDQWKSIGRDADEKVGALYALAMLAAEDRFYEVADRALQEAVRLQPDSRILWRVRISLSEGSPEIVDEAYRNCPQDSEIMLSKLVLETQRHGGGLSAGSSTNRVAGDWGWATNMVSDIVAAGSFSPGTLVRAGDYLLSRGQTELAARLARAAIVDCRGLLAAYVLGLQVALRQQDLKWANECAISGIENAQDPTPFYKILVDIKAYGRKVDSYLIEALEYLQDQKGAGPQWSEMLGKIYFQKGDVQRSLSIFSSVIRGDTRNVSMGTLILAAEAARRNAKMKKAVSILESAYEAMPDRVPVLNNLVYLLAQDPSTLARARALMPKLVELGGDSFAVMDTIAMVYMRSGDMDNARLWMNKAMKSLKANSYSAQEVRLNAAEIEMRSGNYKKAREAIDQLRHNNDRTDFIDQKARGLMREINALKEGIE
jgi:tetratricopeptide (TPR) repeat protein